MLLQVGIDSRGQALDTEAGTSETGGFDTLQHVYHAI